MGLDGGALKIGIGLRYGLLDDLDVGLLRLNGTVETFDTYEFDGRWRFLRQEQFGIDLAARGGLTWFVQEDAEDALGAFGQLLVDRIFADRVLVGGALLFHSSSSNAEKSNADDDYSLAGAVYAEYRFLPFLAVDIEVATTIVGYHSKYPSFAGGLKMYTHLHTFSVLVTNTQYVGADGVVANTHRGDPKDWLIGFTITREI